MKRFAPVVVLMAIFLSSPRDAVNAAQPEPGEQVPQSLRTSDSADMEYLLYLPEGYEPDQQQQKKFPLMLFLHGRGESHGPLSLVAKWGPPRMVEHGAELPYILVSPQCPGDQSWGDATQQQRLVELLDHLTEQYAVDASRIYLTGLSMGGFGSWQLAADHPQRFAAVVPICGGGDPADADQLKDLPIWVWHGTEDGAVPFEKSQEMVDAIRQAGSDKLRFTALEHIGHNSWSAAYATPELFDWLNQQKR